MKSYNTSFPFRRALLAAAVALATGTGVAIAQSGSGSSSGSSSSPSSGTSNSSYNNTTSGTGSNYGSSSSSNYGSSNGSSMSSTSASDTDMSTNRSSSSSSDKKLSWSDRRFVTKAADDGQAEVQVAQLAAQKANNPDVRNFAQQLVQQHTQVNSELMSIASSKNVKLDKDDGKDRSYRRLSKASGSDFDREFVEHMVDEHEKDIKLFEKAANDAKDTEVRQFASKTLDHLRQHLAEAQRLQQSIVPTGKTNDDTWSSPSGSSNSSSSTSGSSMESGSTNSSGSTGSSGINGSNSSGSSSSSPSSSSTSSSTTGGGGR